MEGIYHAGLLLLMLLGSLTLNFFLTGPQGCGTDDGPLLEETRGSNRKAARTLQQAATQYNSCPQESYIYSGPTMDSIFDSLTAEEYISATEFVANALNFTVPATGYPSVSSRNGTLASAGGGTAVIGGASAVPGLNLNITQYDSYIFNTFLFPVNKGEALDYLDLGGPLPKRFARVIAIRGAHNPPDVMEYKVGPLPLGPGSFIEPLYKSGQIPYVKRPANDLAEALALGEWANAVMVLLKDLFFAFMEQCGAQTDPQCTGNNITAFNIVPATRENGKNRIAAILHFYNAGSTGSSDLHNIPFAYKIDTTDQNFTNWRAFEFEFCGQGFEQPHDLLDAFKNGTLQICTPAQWLTDNYSAKWADDVEQGGPRPGVDKPGPRLYEPAGKRFKLLQGDSNTSRVFQWASWQGHVTTHAWTGLSFHDIRFKGERIIYELSLNDLMVVYSGYSTSGQTFYYDSYDQLGGSQYSLRPGYDCPETATYMPVTMMGMYGQQFLFPEAVCFFENADSNTAWRHFDFDTTGQAESHGIRRYEFVVRSVVTVGNYDYIISVRFQLDGSIKCEVEMAGYLQASYFDTEFTLSKNDAPYGTRVHYNTFGNIHDHLNSWKVDFDVAGTNNSFRITSLKAGTYEDALGPGTTPPWALKSDVMKYLEDKLIEREAGFVLDYKAPQTFCIVNPEFKNSVGVPRGYTIVHGHTTTQLLPDTHPLTKAASWSKYHIAVTQRHEDEPTSTKDYYDTHSAGDPIWSLDMALNNESIVGQDLVAWVSMGLQHIPRSEDVPLISNLPLHFMVKPHNYFDQLPSLDVADFDDFQACAAEQGTTMFDYNFSFTGQNRIGYKSGFKVAAPLTSSDIFRPSASLMAALSAERPSSDIPKAHSPGL